MKAISSSFVVFSGTLLLMVSGMTIGGYGGMREIQSLAGGAMILIGLIGWWRELSKDQQA